jgi:hypothetical protein
MNELTRQEVIDELRTALLAAGDGEHSNCRVVREKHLFCQGFAQWKLHELKQRYPQIVRSRPRLSRNELEELADRWQLARQFVTGKDLSCDVQVNEGRRQTCRGWDEFDDQQLERFYLELCGAAVRIREPAARA